MISFNLMQQLLQKRFSFVATVMICFLAVVNLSNASSDFKRVKNSTNFNSEDKSSNLCKNNNLDISMVAEYNYTITDKNTKKSQEQALILWRRNNQVVIELPEMDKAELWERTKNNALHLTRYFEGYQRGIEYQPGEIKAGREANDWSVKYQLISNKMIERMRENGSEVIDGCRDLKTLQLDENETHLTLLWFPKEKMIKTLTVDESTIISELKLKNVNYDSVEVDDYFNTLLSYQTTDYADIGDNESDPFLKKMINLGFVEHGSSGFYDSQGKDIGSHHH